MAKKGKVQGRASKAKAGMHMMPGGQMMSDAEMKKRMGKKKMMTGALPSQMLRSGTAPTPTPKKAKRRK